MRHQTPAVDFGCATVLSIIISSCTDWNCSGCTLWPIPP